MTRITASLTNRIFLASALLATLSLGFAFYFVNARVSAEAEADLRRGLAEASTLVDLRRETLTETFATYARMVADIPKLKAAAETQDANTLQPIAEEFRARTQADLLVVTGRSGTVLAADGADTTSLSLVHGEDSLDETIEFLAHPRGVLQVITVPVFLLGSEPPLFLGRLSMGFFMDDGLAARFKELTGSEVAFAIAGRIVASSLPPQRRAPLAAALSADGIVSVDVSDEEFLALSRPMTTPGAIDAAARPVTLVLRSRTERLRFLNTLRTGLAGALIVTVLLATIVSYGVARTVTRPLSTVTSAMRDVAATGDLSRRVSVRSRAWDDEDARLLASAFNTLTESIARFQREAAQKERLSSLGRLSTVIAHEIRNPLMIIRASLASLRRDRVGPEELREAVADIDEETTRLNRVVTEVLDFARPIRFQLSEANINDICRASAAAAWAGDDGRAVRLDLDPALPAVVTDAERLRTALVNILTNARHATEAAAAASAPREPVTVTTRRTGERIAVTVRDHGVGIAPEDMAHIFDPYFTTRRAGTGLGLPITKNIVEGLGGTIAVSSTPGEGTEIRIDLPLATRGAAA